MTYEPKYHHTADQLAALRTADAYFPSLFRDLIRRAAALNATVVPAGSPAGDGDVVRNGANFDVIRRRETYLEAAAPLARYVDRDYADYVRWSHKIVGGRFLTEAEMASGYAHLAPLVEAGRVKWGLA